MENFDDGIFSMMESLEYKCLRRVMTSAYKEIRVTCVTFDPVSRDAIFIANNRGTIVYKMKNPSCFKEKLSFWLYRAPDDHRVTKQF